MRTTWELLLSDTIFLNIHYNTLCRTVLQWSQKTSLAPLSRSYGSLAHLRQLQRSLLFCLVNAHTSAGLDLSQELLLECVWTVSLLGSSEKKLFLWGMIQGARLHGNKARGSCPQVIAGVNLNWLGWKQARHSIASSHRPYRILTVAGLLGGITTFHYSKARIPFLGLSSDWMAIHLRHE